MILTIYLGEGGREREEKKEKKRKEKVMARHSQG